MINLKYDLADRRQQTAAESRLIAVSPKEAAKALGIGTTQLYELIGVGAIPAKKLGRRTLILLRDLDNFAQSLPGKAVTGDGRIGR